jgi:hypothetical protein
MDALLAFAAALLALRLAGGLVTRWRARRRPELLAWAGSLGAYAAASAALAWGSAAGWGDEVFRAFYLFGGLLTAPLLGLGSLLLVGRRAAIPVVLVYCGLAAGVAISEPLTAPVSGAEIPDASEHLDLVPARMLAIVGNSLGTLAAVGVALRTIRRRPLGNSLLLAGIVTAAAGSALAGLGAAEAGVSIAVAAALLYAGFILNK